MAAVAPLAQGSRRTQESADEEDAEVLLMAGSSTQKPAHWSGDAIDSGGGGGPLSAARRALDAFWANGTACALGSSLAFASAALFVKALHNEVPVFEIVLIRAILSASLTAASCRANGYPLLGQTAPQWLLVARGIIGASAMTLSYEALVRLPLADSTVIFYISPALTALLCWLILGEPLGWLTAGGCLASLVGVALVAQPPWLVGGHVEWGRERLMGTLFGLAGATLAAGAYTCIRTIGKREAAITIAMYFHLAALISSAVPLAAGYPEPAVLPSPLQGLLMVCVAVGSFGGNLLVNRAFQLETAAKASAVNFTQVIFAYTFQIVFFHDPITPAGLAGTALIAAGVLIVNADKLLRARAAAPAAPLDAAAAAGGICSSNGGSGGSGGLPTRHTYQLLGPPAEQQQQASWWRRLWGRGDQPSQQQQQQQQQQEEEEEQRTGPDYRGRLKSKRSDRFSSELVPTEVKLAFDDGSGAAAAEEGSSGHGNGGGGRRPRSAQLR